MAKLAVSVVMQRVMQRMMRAVVAQNAYLPSFLIETLTALFALAALQLVTSTPARARELGRWAPQIALASSRFGVPKVWIERVMLAESSGQTQLGGRPIRSRKGAIGLMQLMPATWAELRGRLGLGRDPDNPRDNILAGTFYLRLLYDRYGYPGLFAAYNAGPRRYERYLAGTPLPAETVAYLARTGGEATRQAVTVARGGPGLFAVLASSGSAPFSPGAGARVKRASGMAQTREAEAAWGSTFAAAEPFSQNTQMPAANDRAAEPGLRSLFAVSKALP